MLVSDIVRRNACLFADREAVMVPGGPARTWAELDERTDRLAKGLLDLGLAKGDRVAVYAPNRAEYIEFFFACAKSGVVGAPLNIRLSPTELTAYLRYVEPSALFVHADLSNAADKFIGEVPSIRHVVGLGPDHGRPLDYEEILGAQEAGDPGVAVAEDGLYQLGATSGTTGTPKAAMLTHRNAVAGMANWMIEMPMSEGGTNLQCIPMFFNPGGPAGLHPVMMKGGRSVILPAFEPGAFLEAVPRYQVTHSILVPTMVGMVLQHPETGLHDLSSLRGILSGGSPFPRAVLRRAKEVFGDVFYPTYGMAETYSCGATLRPENQHVDGTEAQVARLASTGKPHVLMQMRVVDVGGGDVPHDNATPGEIWMRGDSVSSGYFEMPEETASSRQDGWFMTGDIAVVDEEGFVTIVDRAKDIIITGGINVFSRDIEEALHTHPAVAQAAAIAIPHERWGESVHAVVVLEAGQEVTEEELIAHAASSLADYKKPRSLEIREALPISATGKILKRELRATFWADQERQV